jgi:hypothetical protein
VHVDLYLLTSPPTRPAPERASICHTLVFLGHNPPPDQGGEAVKGLYLFSFLYIILEINKLKTFSLRALADATHTKGGVHMKLSLGCRCCADSCRLREFIVQ